MNSPDMNVGTIKKINFEMGRIWNKFERCITSGICLLGVCTLGV